MIERLDSDGSYPSKDDDDVSTFRAEPETHVGCWTYLAVENKSIAHDDPRNWQV